MNATHKALAMIGMTKSDYERADFNRRSGRKAAAALRSMGYSRERFPTRAGHAIIRWAAPATGSEYRPPVCLSDEPTFNVLVIALANG